MPRSNFKNLFRFWLLGLTLIGSMSPAHGALVQDQVGATMTNLGVRKVLQYFRPSQDNLAGVDVYVFGTVPPGSDVTLSVWEYSAWDGGIGNYTFSGTPLVSSIVEDVSDNALTRFLWSPVAVTVDQAYILYFSSNMSTLAFGLQISSSGFDPYTRGEIVSFNYFGHADVQFTTYYESNPVLAPLPPAIWLFGSALAGLSWFGKRTVRQ